MPHAAAASAPELVLDAKATLAEGPLWSARERCLYWIDIIAQEVHRFDPASGRDERRSLDGMPGAVVERSAGGLLLAWQRGFAAYDFAANRIEPWTHPESTVTTNRFNDGKVGPDGAFWAGTMSSGAVQGPVGSFYRLDPARRVAKFFEGVCVSNGLAWTADRRTLYYIDTPTNRIDAFTVDYDTPRLLDRRAVVTIDPKEHGWMDGMCIDAEGMLWVGHYGGSRLNRFDPRTGTCIRTVPLPVSNVTSCCFGGEKLDHLYITTAWLGLSEAQRAKEPQAGGIYRLHTGPIGVPSALYAG
jgi:sugar lactone lactonase YvrE